MADAKISDLTEATSVDGTEYVEMVQSGTNKKVPTSLLAITREFNRTFVEALVFDKHEIFHEPFTQTTALNLTIGAGALTDQASSMRFRMTADGVNPINFGAGFDFLYGITNGQILDAGTYEFYFLYTNGSVSVNVPGVTAESSSITQLSAPANFAAVPGAGNPETEVDLTWDDVANESSYEIQYSDTGGSGPWQALNNPAAGSTSYTHTGLTAGTTYHYRIRAKGDGISFGDSAFSVDATTTQSGGDVTAPTFTFSPASGNTTWAVNAPIVITANEGLQNTDGSAITDANVATRITLKETNSGGADIAFTATIDVTKTIITITPTTMYGDTQLVYVAINNVEDVNGNEVTVAVSSTFTTTDFTLLNGTSNRMRFGDILDSLFAVTDTNFWYEITLKDPSLSGTHIIAGKSAISGNQRGSYLYSINTDIYFAWYALGTASHLRVIKWAGALLSGTHTYIMKYDGSIDTNDGLDRCILLVDGGTAGSKTLDITLDAMSKIFSNTAQLAIGILIDASSNPVNTNYFSGEAKDFIIRSGAGSVVEINVPLIRTGTDTSGNGRNGIWA